MCISFSLLRSKEKEIHTKKEKPALLHFSDEKCLFTALPGERSGRRGGLDSFANSSELRNPGGVFLIPGIIQAGGRDRTRYYCERVSEGHNSERKRLCEAQPPICPKGIENNTCFLFLFVLFFFFAS